MASMADPQISNDDIRGGIADSLEAIAYAIYPDAAGSPRAASGNEVRIGNNGSLKLIVQGPDKGAWYDHEAGAGGGPMELVAEAYGIPRKGNHGRLREACLDVLGWRDGEALPEPQRPKKTAAEIEREDAARKAEALEKASKARKIILQSVKPTGDGASYLKSRDLPIDAPNVLWLPDPGLLPVSREIKAHMQAEGATGAIVFVARTAEDDPRAVQCVVIAAGGHPVLEPEKPNKKPHKLKRTFGKTSDPKNPAAFRLPGPDHKPLVITDGPEDALSAYAAGYPAMAALGSAFKNLDPEPNRALGIFGDNDAPGSRADKTLDKAAAYFTDKGHEVRIARAPEPHKDANDLLQAEGQVAVTAAIEAATLWEPPPPPGRRLKPYYPLRRATRAEGALAMHTAMDGALQAGYLAANVRRARAEIKRRFKEWSDKRKAELVEADAGQIGPDKIKVPKAERRAAGKRIRAEFHAETGFPTELLKGRFTAGSPGAEAIKPNYTLIASDVGSGKSHSAEKLISELGSGMAIDGKPLKTWLVSPTLKKVREGVASINSMAGQNGSRAFEWPGLQAEDEETGERLCKRPAAMDALLGMGSTGVSIGKRLCDDGKGNVCPYKADGSCRLQQLRGDALEAAEHGDRGVVIVLAHANMTKQSAAPKPDVIVIDEDVTGEAVAEMILTIEQLNFLDRGIDSTAPKFVQDAVADAAEAFDEVMPKITEALIAGRGGRDLIARMREAGVTNEAIEALRRALSTLAGHEAYHVRPSMTEASIIKWVEGAQKSPIGAQRAFLATLADEIPSIPLADYGAFFAKHVPADNEKPQGEEPVFKDHSARIDFMPERTGPNEAPAKVKFSARQEVLRIKKTGALFLDATGDRDRLAEAIGIDRNAIDFVDTRAPLPALRLRVTGRSFAKGQLAGDEGAGLRKRIGTIVEAFGGRNAFVAAPKGRAAKPILSALMDLAPEGTKGANYGGLRGLNVAEECPVGFLIGREQPRARTIEAIVATRLGADAADLDLIGHEIDLEPGRTGKPQDMRYSRQVRRQTRYNGGQPLDGDVPAIVEVDALPDPRTDRELVAIRDAEIVQAAGRVRPYRNCRVIFDMTSTGAKGAIGTNPDLQHTLDVDWNDLLTMAKFALAARRNGGALPMTKKALAAISPEIFHNAGRQLKALEAMATERPLRGVNPYNRNLIYDMTPLSAMEAEVWGKRAKAVQNTLATLGFGLAIQAGIRGAPARLVLLTPDADPAAARDIVDAKPEHWRVLTQPSPTPPMLEALAAESETRDRAWLEANKAECDAAGVEFNPEIKRISASDYCRPADQSGGQRAAILPASPPAIELTRDEAIVPPEQQPPLPGASWIEPKAITTPTLPRCRPVPEPEWLDLPREQSLFADVGGLPADGDPDRLNWHEALAYAETGGKLPDNLAGSFNAVVRYRWMDHDAAAREAGAGSRSHLSNARTGTFGLSPDKARALVAWIARHCGHDMPDPAPMPPGDKKRKGYHDDNGATNSPRLPARPPSNENGPSDTLGSQRLAE